MCAELSLMNYSSCSQIGIHVLSVEMNYFEVVSKLHVNGCVYQSTVSAHFREELLLRET